MRIVLRGPDVRDVFGNSIPCYVDFNTFKINNKDIINENIMVWCYDPYIFEKNIKNGDIIDVHVEWTINDSQ